jgi:hypothetical protein
MIATLLFVPPGGGEPDHSLVFELPSVPQAGDYISVTRHDQQGTKDFIVRRSWWYLEHPETGAYETIRHAGRMAGLSVECEFARGPYSSEGHRRECDAYERGGREVQSFEATAY